MIYSLIKNGPENGCIKALQMQVCPDEVNYLQQEINVMAKVYLKANTVAICCFFLPVLVSVPGFIPAVH